MMKIVWFGFVLAALSAEGDVILSQPGQTVTFACGVSGTVVWRHNNDKLIMLRNGFISRGQGDIAQRSELRDTYLEIRGVKETDHGKFTCSSPGVTTREHTHLVVTVSSTPSGDLQLGNKATLLCQVEGLMTQSTVQWRRPDGSQYPGSEVADLTSVTLSDAGQWNCIFSHEGVTYSQGLDIKVTAPAATTPAPVLAPNPKDTNEPTSNKCTTDCPSPPSGIDWWIWAAIGAGCLVVIFLVVLVICVCKRIKRRKRKLQEMQMGCLLLVPKQYCQCECPTAAPKPQQRRRRERPSAPTLQPPRRNDMKSQSEERVRERDR